MRGRQFSGVAALALAVVAGLSTAGPAGAATFVVENTNDAGPDSLRAAVAAANATAAADVITFAIPGAGAHVITLATPLPALTSPVTINGASQPGFGGSPLVQVDNGTGNAGAVGFDLTGGASKVIGLSITRFGTGIRLRTHFGNTITGSWIGVGADGFGHGNGTGIRIGGGSLNNVVGGTTAAARNVISSNDVGVELDGTNAGTSGNSIKGNYVGTNTSGGAGGPGGNTTGIWVHAGGNTIGGTAAGAGNLVSGNTGGGVLLSTPLATGNVVEGNLIGTNASGTAAHANGDGVAIRQGARTNTIGGTASGARNVISGNAGAGVLVTGVGTSKNVVAGDYIGTTVSGSAALGNHFGVQLAAGASGNRVGGTSPSARNVVSGNAADGVRIGDSGTSGNVVEGNVIGTTPGGTSAVANGCAGVGVAAGASGNTIGGSASGARNVISGNGCAGVLIGGAGASANVVAGNYVGLDSSGGSALPNADGVSLTSGATGNTIGGGSASTRNVISGNSNAGVKLFNASTTGNVVSSNYVGTDASGANFPGAQVFGVDIVGASANTIGGTTLGRRNVIVGATAIDIENATKEVVEGNYIGTDASGGSILDTPLAVVLDVGATGNTIGGSGASARNVIGATNLGVLVAGKANTVSGNYVGTDATGTAALLGLRGAGQTGVTISGSGNTVGGTSAGERNLISGNAAAGVVLNGTTAKSNVVEGNYVGTDVTGGNRLQNGVGVHLHSGAHANTIGGTTAGARNVISGNGDGVVIADSGTTGNLVQGNFVGTDASGTGSVSNAAAGIGISNGASGNVVGGTVAGAGNTISFNGGAFNGGQGVLVDGSTTVGDAIERNTIFDNAKLGIDLENGGNRSQPPPTITSVTTAGGTTTIKLHLASFAGSTSFRVEVFTSPTCQLSSGKTFLAAKTATTNGSGDADLTIAVPARPPGESITATATRANGDTSLYGLCTTTP